jgi:energy-coupling factor transporter ATP-binding protein EcfA2
MERLSIADCADQRLTEVSGGQAQRAAVARALVHRPAVILADEPTGALDSRGGEQVLDALIGAAREQDTAVLIVTHELAVAARAERDLILRDGRIVGDSRLPAGAGPAGDGPLGGWGPAGGAPPPAKDAQLRDSIAAAMRAAGPRPQDGAGPGDGLPPAGPRTMAGPQ